MESLRTPLEIDTGLFRWATPHPEWHTTIEWGHEVASWALVCGDSLVLVDPLVPATGEAGQAHILAALDGLAEYARAVEIMVTIPYHARSAEPLYHRWRETRPTRIWGHRAVATRFLRDDTPLELIRTGKDGAPAELAASVLAFPIGNPRRYETPLWFPGHRALAFGDALVGFDDTLRIWQQGPFSTQWYREKFLPTLLPLLKLDVERVLATHGPPALTGGREALRAALSAPPWDHTAK
jgi:hypothetical protein